MSDEFEIVCGKCKVGAEVVTDASGEEEAVCPSCGQRDKVADAFRIAGEQLADDAARTVQDVLGKSVRGSKVMKFEANRIPRRSFRWHAVSN